LSTEKKYKVSFKIYQNDRLKPVLFHGKQINPLYIQLTFDRQPIYFKSYYFDLLSKPQYAARHFTGNKYPAIKEVEAKEEKLINFIIEKYSDDFSLQLFKEKYTYYSRDLLSMMEGDFKDYLFTFFNDEGDNLLASMISLIGVYESGFRIVEGLKRPLKPALYEKMINNAAYYAPPYLPLMTLAHKKGEGWLTTLSVYEWEADETLETFDKLMSTSYPEYDKAKAMNYIQKLKQQ
jgi:hypothetical protein